MQVRNETIYYRQNALTPPGVDKAYRGMFKHGTHPVQGHRAPWRWKHRVAAPVLDHGAMPRLFELAGEARDGRNRDVTERLGTERRLAATQANLLRATRLSAMGAMASGLAHELNQPLAAASNFIATAARLLDQGLATPGSPARASLDDAGAQLRRASDIVRRLVGFVERGEAELRLEDTRMVAREACEVARAEGSSGDARLDVTIGCEPCMALVDRTQMQQVLLNLIRNSTEAFECSAEGHISVDCRAVRDAVEITVTDDGPGLAPEIAARLFQPFVSTKPQGMGIGLTICRTIVEGHGGILSAASPAGGGQSFTIWLPQAGWWERGAGEPAMARPVEAVRGR